MLVPQLCAAPATLQPPVINVLGFLSGLVQCLFLLYHQEAGLVNAEVIEVPLEPKGSGHSAGICVLPFLMCCNAEGKGPCYFHGFGLVVKI